MVATLEWELLRKESQWQQDQMALGLYRYCIKLHRIYCRASERDDHESTGEELFRPQQTAVFK